MKLKKRLLFFFCVTLLLKAGAVFASETPELGGLDLTNMIVYFFNFLLSAAIGLSVLAVALGGIYHLISLGSGKMIGEGKAWVKAGILGLLIVMSSYLIIWTINPDLVTIKIAKLWGLIPVPVITIPPPGPFGPSAGAFEEIPIGMLTERLLSRTSYCYDFGENGDPIDGDLETDIMEPTFFPNHDRLDCLSKLEEAAERKANIVKQLSNEIITLMSECKCGGQEDIKEECSAPSVNSLANSAPINELKNRTSFIARLALAKSQNTPISLAAEDPPCTPDEVKACDSCSAKQCDADGKWGSCVDFDFSMTVVEIPPVTVGKPVTAYINITKVSPSWVPSASVSLTFSGAPSGSSITPTKCSPNCSATMTIPTAGIKPQDKYNVLIKGSACGLHRSVNAYFKILPGPPVGLTATSILGDRYLITWKKGEGAEKTRILRSIDGTSKEIYFGTEEYFIDSGLTPNKLYCYEAASWAPTNNWSEKVTTNCVCSEIFRPSQCQTNFKDKCKYWQITQDPSTCDTGACEGNDGRCECNINPLCNPPCPPGNKEKAAHGPITFNSCEGAEKDPSKEKVYKGLDEFKVDLIELIEKVGKEKVCKGICSTLKYGFDGCQEFCEGLSPKEISEQYDADTVVTALIESDIWKTTLEGKEVDIPVINKEIWDTIPLVAQIKYFNGKIKSQKAGIDTDLNNLYEVENKLAGCYAPKSYLGLLRLMQQNSNITVGGASGDISKYCKGFGHNDGIFNLCQKICPAINKTSFASLRSCGGDADCAKTEFYKCPEDNDLGVETFKECLTTAAEQCKTSCQNEYPNCEDALKGCEDACETDSEYLFERDEINVNFGQVAQCAKDHDIFEDFVKCMESTIPMYCTSQYPGYPDCRVEPPLKEDEPSTSLYFYQNPERHKDYLSTFVVPNKVSPVYPESKKCPFFSMCPQCPYKDKEFDEKGLFCNADCMDFSYNDDPLTFYCRTSWAPEFLPENYGWTCSANNEIPVGQTVDEAEKWGKDMSEKTGKFIETLSKMIKDMDTIGEQKDYCECNSICKIEKKDDPPITDQERWDLEKTCNAKCEYNERHVQGTDPDTGMSYDYWVCYCAQKPCEGNPCQKIINMLAGKDGAAKCPEGTEYKGMFWFHEEIKKTLTESDELIKKGRSEPLKRLAYSRDRMDECGALSTEYGAKTMEPLDCTTSYFSTHTIKERCYGILEGIVRDPSENLLDNWFCCSAPVQ
ncbi:MAG: hypothetical protein WC845_00870 [Candidatus Staskawiczbacteria bacterium]|jgi:hypothetical protein